MVENILLTSIIVGGLLYMFGRSFYSSDRMAMVLGALVTVCIITAMITSLMLVWAN